MPNDIHFLHLPPPPRPLDPSECPWIIQVHIIILLVDFQLCCISVLLAMVAQSYQGEPTIQDCSTFPLVCLTPNTTAMLRQSLLAVMVFRVSDDIAAECPYYNDANIETHPMLWPLHHSVVKPILYLLPGIMIDVLRIPLYLTERLVRILVFLLYGHFFDALAEIDKVLEVLSSLVYYSVFPFIRQHAVTDTSSDVSMSAPALNPVSESMFILPSPNHEQQDAKETNALVTDNDNK